MWIAENIWMFSASSMLSVTKCGCYVHVSNCELRYCILHV